MGRRGYFLAFAIAAINALCVGASSAENTYGSAPDNIKDSLDRLVRSYPDQIAGHARRKASASHEEPHLGNLACEVNHGLAGRVASTDQGNFLTGAQLRFKRRGPIVNTCSFELLNSGNRQSTVTCAAGNHDGTGKRMLTVRQLQGKGTYSGVDRPIQSNHFIGDGHLDTEFLRLIEGAPHVGLPVEHRENAQVRREFLISESAR